MRKILRSKNDLAGESFDEKGPGKPDYSYYLAKKLKEECFLPVYTSRMLDVVRQDFHWIKHSNYPYLALELTLSGSIEYLSEKSRIVSLPGTIYVIPPGSRVRIVKSGDRLRRKLTLIIQGSALRTNLEALNLHEQTAIRLQTPEQIESLMRQIGDVIENTGTAWENSRLTYELLLRLAEEHQPEQKPLPLWEKALALLNEHYGSDISISQLAEQLQISEATLNRLFRKNAKLSPYGYLQQLRLRKAAEQLTNSRLPVKEIAFRCGFNSPSAFSAAEIELLKLAQEIKNECAK